MVKRMKGIVSLFFVLLLMPCLESHLYSTQNDHHNNNLLNLRAKSSFRNVQTESCIVLRGGGNVLSKFESAPKPQRKKTDRRDRWVFSVK